MDCVVECLVAVALCTALLRSGRFVPRLSVASSALVAVLALQHAHQAQLPRLSIKDPAVLQFLADFRARAEVPGKRYIIEPVPDARLPSPSRV